MDASALRDRLARGLDPLVVGRCELEASTDPGARRLRLALEVETDPIDPGAPVRAWLGAVRAAEARGGDPDAGPVDGILLGRAREALPATAAFLTAVASILDLVEFQAGRRPRLDLNSSRDAEGLRARFPELDRWIDRLGPAASLEAILAPVEGGRADRLLVRSEDAWFEWSAELDPTRAERSTRWEGAVSADLALGGIAVRLHDQPFSLAIEPGPASISARLEVDRRPRHLEVAGRGLSPAARDLVRARAAIDWRVKDGRSRLAIDAELELLLPDLILEAARTTASLLAATAGAAPGGLERLGREIVLALVTDLGRAAARG